MMITSLSRQVKEFPKPKDQSFNTKLHDLYNQFRTAGIDISTHESFKSVIGNVDRREEYIDALTSDIQNESVKEALKLQFEHSMELMAFADHNGLYQDESAASANVHMYSFLNGPVIRAIWAKSIVPQVMRVVPMTTTSYACTFDTPYLLKNGKRYDLPYATVDEENPVIGLTKLNSIPASDGGAAYINDEGFAMFTSNVVTGNVILESIEDSKLEDYNHVDDRVVIAKLIVTGLNADDSQKAPSSIDVEVRPSSKSGKASSIIFISDVDLPTDKAEDLSGTIFVELDKETGAYKATTTSQYIKGFQFDAYLTAENNRNVSEVRQEQRSFEVHIGKGEHVMINTPIELLQDYGAAHGGADYVVTMTDVTSDLYAGTHNQELLAFLAKSHKRTASDFIPTSVLRGANKTGDFDIRVAFGERPSAYTDEQLKKCISWYMGDIHTVTRIEDGFWSIVGERNNIMYIPDFKTQSYGQNEGMGENTAKEQLGFRVAYALGFTTNVINGTVRALYTPEVSRSSGLICFFNSTDEKRPTYIYHPYSYTVSRGYLNPGQPNVPSIMITKRHAFEVFIPSQVRIKLLGNDGGQFTSPKGVGMTP